MSRDARQKKIDESEESKAFFSSALNSALGFFILGAKQGRVRTDKELLERLDAFFMTCSQEAMMPTVEKMALAIGMDVKAMNDIAEGRKQGLAGSFATGEIIRQAKLVIASVDAELASTGKIQPVVYIWRSKNYYGMYERKDALMIEDNTGRSERDLIAEAAALPQLDAPDKHTAKKKKGEET